MWFSKSTVIRCADGRIQRVPDEERGDGWIGERCRGLRWLCWMLYESDWGGARILLCLWNRRILCVGVRFWVMERASGVWVQIGQWEGLG
jgi:hypothetical protein